MVLAQFANVRMRWSRLLNRDRGQFHGSRGSLFEALMRAPFSAFAPRCPLPAALIAAGLLLAPSRGGAQYLTRPNIPWRIITTEHFEIHFPAEMQEWTQAVASRIESVASAVNAAVGNQPASRVTVMVEDPTNDSNGFALPLLEGPVIFLWPTPPSPSPTFGTHRGWGEVLAVHEYAHIAHLTFPTRNPRERFFWSLLPTQLSPVARKAPAWVIEGYATLIEGQLTGSGRPSSVGRAAVMREWALEGKFPTYGALNGSGAFLGGNMRYLVGSAFLEWLQQRQGDSSLVHLWRRMSARQERSFASAFVGVFGAAPQDLYGLFTVDVMERALAVRNELRQAGLVDGELVQRLSAGTGDPAFSPDGKKVAIVVRSLVGPSRVVVWESTVPAVDSAAIRARARLLARDSLDVPAIDSFPRPRRALATLRPSNGRAHDDPRWMPDGVQVLVTRNEPVADLVVRPDLFLWNTSTGAVRRVTRGASVREADPSPDGRQAVAVRCDVGICGLVLVDLRSGEWHRLVGASPDSVWNRPRWSPNGRSIAASVQANGLWRVALVDPSTGGMRLLDPGDGAARHSPAWTPEGDALVVVSERGGIANLERLPLDGSAPQALTRVTGAVLSPDVNRADSTVAFLTLRSGGLDLRRLPSTDASAAVAVVALGTAESPAAPSPAPGGMTFAEQSVGQGHDYGLGPRRWRLLPGGQYGPDGSLATLMLANIDPISRLSVVAQGGYGTPGTWRGGALSLALRRLAVQVDAAGWYVDHFPSRQGAGDFAPVASDVRYKGVGALGQLDHVGGSSAWVLRAGGSIGRVGTEHVQDATRSLVTGEARARLTMGVGSGTVSITGGAGIQTGNTAGDSWTRVLHSATIVAGTSRQWLRGEYRGGSVDHADPADFGRLSEQFLVGGTTSPWFDPTWMAQRIPLPAVPGGFVSGRQYAMFRVSTGWQGLEPYFTWVAAGDSLSDFKRLAGIEQSLAFSSMGWVRLPAVRLRFGAAYSFDEPLGYHIRGYAAMTYSP